MLSREKTKTDDQRQDVNDYPVKEQYVLSRLLPEYVSLYRIDLNSGKYEILRLDANTNARQLAEKDPQRARLLADTAVQAGKIFDLSDYAVLSAPFQLAAAEQDGPKALELLDRLLRSLTVPWDLSASPLYPHLPTKDAAEESQRSLIPVLLDGTARDPDCAFLRAEPGWPELLARYQT